MKTLKNYLLILLAGLVAGAAAIFFFVEDDKQPTITRTVILEQLESASELISTKYHYSEVGKFENSIDMNGWDIPLTKKFFILTFEGEVDLGVDLSEADVNFQEDTIQIELPAIKVLNNTIDENSIEVYDESKNIFNPISINDYKNFASEQKEKIEEDIQSKNVYEKAEKNTIKAIQALFHDQNIKVTFKN